MSDEPINEYDNMTVGEVESAVSPYTNGLDSLNDAEVVERLDLVTEIYEYELENKDRKTAKGHIEVVRDQIQEEAEARGLTDDVSDGSSAESSEEETESEEEEPEEEPEVEQEEEEVDRDPSNETFRGNDGSERVMVRNPDRTSKNVAGYQFHAGEVKDLKATDRILNEVRANELQVVK